MALRTPTDDEFGSPRPTYMRFITAEEWQEGVNRLGRVDEFGDPVGLAEFAQMLMAEVGQTHAYLFELDDQAPAEKTDDVQAPEPTPVEQAPSVTSADSLYRALAEVLGEEEAITGGLGVSEFMALVGRVVEKVDL